MYGYTIVDVRLLHLNRGRSTPWSIESLRSSVDSSNLKLVTLQGVVHLSRSRQNELGGKCGRATFTLQDDTGSIDVAIRRSNRLNEPLREGDRVQVTAQIEVFRDRENIPVRVCVEAWNGPNYFGVSSHLLTDPLGWLHTELCGQRANFLARATRCWSS
jgi:DNA/RNA endonuclease YhcR with UshA esterase domain